MGVDIAEAAAKQPIAFDELQRFLVARHDSLRQILEIAQENIATAQIPHRKLTDYKRMSQDVARLKQAHKSIKPAVDVLCPDRGVDQDHQRMIPNSGNRFSEKNILKQKSGAG